MRTPSLTFLGATGTVTGSRHLVETSATRLLVDAGTFQGPKELRRRNREPFPVDPGTLAAVVLTRAHPDHSGALPQLVREGFAGPVLCTPETAELAEIVLRDDAVLREEDAAHADAAGFSTHTPALPLFDSADVEKALTLLEPVAVHQPLPVADDLTVTLRSAGHLLGSTSVLVEGDAVRALFSGDLGRPDHPLVAAGDDPPGADVVVVESTHGDRAHPTPGDAWAEALRRTLDRGGAVLVPAFLGDRTELVLLEIGRLMDLGLVPDVPVYLDSPMALAALNVYRRTLERAGVPHGFGIPDLRTAVTPEASRDLDDLRRPCVVVAGSGRATGGRVLHHLARLLPDPAHTVVLTGHQAEGTRGRLLADGAREVKVHGRYVPVRAEVLVEDRFAVHADAGEVLAWLRRLPVPPRSVYVVHGEDGAARALADRVEDELGWSAVVPRHGERVLLG